MNPTVYFDNDGKLRVLDQVTLKRSAALREESKRFISSKPSTYLDFTLLPFINYSSPITPNTEVKEFQGGVDSVLLATNDFAKIIRHQQQKALGQRIKFHRDSP